MAFIAALLVTGGILLFLETVLPGLVAGILGLCSIIIAVGLAYGRFDLRTGNTVMGIAIAGLITGAILYIKYFPNSKMARLFVSHQTIGQIGNEDPSLIHQIGETSTALRPSGKAVINGRRLDVISEGGFVEAGQAVKVVGIEGLRIVVRPIG